MKWWLRLLTKHELSRGLFWFTIINLAIVAATIWWLPPTGVVLALWALPTLSYLYTIVTMTRVLLAIHSVGADVTTGTYGFWLVAIFDSIFSLIIVVPSFLNWLVVSEQPITLFGIVFTFGYTYGATTFFLVARRGSVMLSRVSVGPMGPPGPVADVTHIEERVEATGAAVDRIEVAQDLVAQDLVLAVTAARQEAAGIAEEVAGVIATAVAAARQEAAGIAEELALRVREAQDEARDTAEHAAVAAAAVASDLAASQHRADAVDDKEDPGAAADAASRSSGKPCVLVVDDYPDILAIVSHELRDDYDVRFASNAEVAMMLLSTLDVVLLLTDLMMPGTNGKKLVVKAREVKPGLKVLFMSGYAVPFGASGEHLIAKPFTGDQLRAKITEVLGA